MSRLGRAVRRHLDQRAAGRQIRRPDDLGRPRSRGRFGLWGPVPFYSRRTRSGAQVSVGGCGCCLPIPLALTVGVAGAVRTVWRRWG